MALLECVRDVFEKDKAKDDVLVLTRLEVAPHLVGGLPEGLLKSLSRCCFLRGLCHCLLSNAGGSLFWEFR